MKNIKSEMVYGEIKELQSLLFTLTNSYRGNEIREELSVSDVDVLENAYSIVTDILDNL